MSNGGDSELGEWKPGRPNILVSGTPGVGKTTICKKCAEDLGLRHIEVGAFAKERDLLAEYDEQLDTYYIHEDEVLDRLEGIMKDGGVVLDYHSVDWFPERWIQMAVVLQCRTEVLYDRLVDRGYSKQKLNNNMECEILRVIGDEVVDNYPKVPLLKLNNNDEKDMDENVKAIKKTYQALMNKSEDGTQDGDVVDDGGTSVDEVR